MSKLTSFTQLDTWKEAHLLVVEVVKLMGEINNRYKPLTDQAMRSAISVTSNISEGFGRQTTKDTKHFYVMARASLTELQNQLLIAKDTNLISGQAFKKLADKTIVVQKLLNGLIRSTIKNAKK